MASLLPLVLALVPLQIFPIDFQMEVPFNYLVFKCYHYQQMQTVHFRTEVPEKSEKSTLQ